MATQVSTINDILISLNGTDEGGNPKVGPWAETQKTYILSEVSIPSAGQVTPVQSGIVLRVFINNKTGEIKTFVAKWLDTPESKFLS